MRNQKLWSLCLTTLCIQCAISPTVEVLAQAETSEYFEEIVEETIADEETLEIEEERMDDSEALDHEEELLAEEETLEAEENVEMVEEEQISEEELVFEEEPIPEEELVLEEEPIPEEELVPKEEPIPEEKSISEVEIPEIEIIPPQIELTNISSSTASADTVIPEIVIEGSVVKKEALNVTLTNSEGQEMEQEVVLIEENGTLKYRMNEIVEDGRYTLVVEGEDAYGNKDRKECTFTVNRNGSIFAHEEMEKIEDPVIKVKNYDDVKIISCMVNGKEADYQWDGEFVEISREYLKPGKNLITLETKDGAGNISAMEPWEIMIDKRWLV